MQPATWPRCWQYFLRSDGKGGVQNEVGSRTKIEKNSSLTYKCECGESFNRQAGDRNEECRDWVVKHTPHLPEEERHE